MECRKTKLLSLALLSATALGGCKKAYEVNRAAYIVGPTNDIKKMGESERREIPASVYNASVLIATQLADKKIKFCSGTLIAGAEAASHGRVLTNHHCFAKQDNEGKAVDELTPEACANTKVYFGYYAGAASSAASIACEPGTMRSSFDGDLAVFDLASAPHAAHQPLPLWDGESVPEGRKAYIVHYPDVAEHLEAVAPGAAQLPVAAVTVQDCQVSGLFDAVEWDLDRTLPFSVRHTCDLIHGSSGSALVDAQTATMIGVNWGGIKVTYDSGTRVDNVATRIDFVKAFLENRADAYVASQREQRLSGSDHAIGGTAASGDAKSESSATRKRKSLCGTVGHLAPPTAGWTLLFLFLPFIVVALQSTEKKECRCLQPSRRR